MHLKGFMLKERVYTMLTTAALKLATYKIRRCYSKRKKINPWILSALFLPQLAPSSISEMPILNQEWAEIKI